MFITHLSVAELTILLLLSASYFFMRLIYGALIDLKITDTDNNRIYKKIFLKQLIDAYTPFLSAIAFFVAIDLNITKAPDRLNFILKVISLIVGIISAIFAFILLRMHYNELVSKPVDEIMESINEQYYIEVQMEKVLTRRKRWRKLRKR